MIALDTSVLIAIMLDEPDAESFQAELRQEQNIIIGWPTLFETWSALTAKGFASPGNILTRFYDALNINVVALDGKHFQAAEQALDRYGGGRHPASLTRGNCFSYAVAAIAKVPLLFKGCDFGKTDLNRHPASSMI